MARVPYVPTEQIDPRHTDLLSRPINLGQALVNSSDGYQNHHMLGAWIRQGSTIDPRQRELLILQVGYTARSPYEFSHHVKIGRGFGVSDDDIRALIANSEGDASASASLSEIDLTLLDAAIELTKAGSISDPLWDTLARSFGSEQLVEIVLIIGYYNHVVRLLSALRVDVEPEYRGLLEEFPLPAAAFDATMGELA